MTGEELKQSILQMAIQGKLVPQDPENDEPAWKLLKRIKEEKEKMIKEKKIKREKTLPPISEDEKTFEIPENWKWVRLGEILKIKSGTSLKESYSGPLYIKVSDMNLLENNFEIVSSKQRCIPKGECLIYPKSIIFPKIGGAIATNKRRKVLRYPICIDPNTMALTVIEPNTFDYIFSWFANIDLAKMASGTALPSLNRNTIANLLIPLPPLEEQKRIVAKLEELQPLIDRYTQLEQKLSQLNKEFPQKLKESILQEAIQGKLTEQDYENDEPAWKLLERIKEEKEKLIKKERPLAPVAEEEKPFDIPTNWEWVRLGEITTYGQPKKKASLELKESSIWSLDLEEIEKNTGKILAFKSANEKKIRSEKTVFSANDVLYSKLRPYLLKILVAPRDGICTSEIIPFSGYSGISSEYIVYFLRSPTTDKNVNSQTYGIKMPRVGTSFMYSLPFPLPPLEEQKRIVAKLEDLQLLTDELNQKLTNHF